MGKNQRNKRRRNYETNMIAEIPVPSIPQDILLEIFEKLGTKSLMRFKCVSKSWRNMIEDPEFILRFQVRFKSCGTNLLVRKTVQATEERPEEGAWKKRIDFLLLDSEAKSFVPMEVPTIVQESFPHFYANKSNWQHVEGLLLLKNMMWNPTTREVFHLPPSIPSWDLSNVIENMGSFAGRDTLTVDSKYFLGFGVSIKKHKVLRISRMSVARDGMKNNDCIRNSQLSAEVLTLGTNCWKKTTSNHPNLQELLEGFEVKAHCCCIKGKIYILCKPCFGEAEIKKSVLKAEIKKSVLIFDISDEKFQLLPLPEDTGHILDDGEVRHAPSKAIVAGELMGRFAVINKDHKKIWVLEADLEGDQTWKGMDLFWPETLGNRNYFLVSAMAFNPIGEIFFSCKGRSQQSAEYVSNVYKDVYVYNIEREDLGKVLNLSGLDRYNSNIFPNFVETIQPLSR